MKRIQDSTRWLGLALACGIITSAVSVEAAKGGGGKPPPEPPPAALYDLVLLPERIVYTSDHMNEAGLVLGSSTLLVPQEENGSIIWYKDDNSDGRNDLVVDLGLPDWTDLSSSGGAWRFNDHGVILGAHARKVPDYGIYLYHAWILAPQMIDGQLTWANLDTNGVNSLIRPLHAADDPWLEVEPESINNFGVLALGINSDRQRGYLLLPNVYEVSPEGAVAIEYPAEDADGDGFNDALIDLGSGINIWGSLGPLIPKVINDRGDIAGEVSHSLAGGDGRPFVLRPHLDENLGLVWNEDSNGDGANDRVIYLTMPERASTMLVKGMNETGTIVGEVYYGSYRTRRAAIWQVVDWEQPTVIYTEVEVGKNRTTDFPTVNAAGQVVGIAEEGKGWIWDQGNVMLLSDLIPELAGYEVGATDILNNGMIAGGCAEAAGGPATSFIAIPVEQP